MYHEHQHPSLLHCKLLPDQGHLTGYSSCMVAWCVSCAANTARLFSDKSALPSTSFYFPSFQIVFPRETKVRSDCRPIHLSNIADTTCSCSFGTLTKFAVLAMILGWGWFGKLGHSCAVAAIARLSSPETQLFCLASPEEKDLEQNHVVP